jgi:HK97 family phage prohead protease
MTVLGEVEYRHVSLGALKTRLDGEGPGTFSGYANLHLVTDSFKTRFNPQAWTLGGGPTTRAYLWMHDPDEPVGVFTWREDEKGLWIEGTYDDTPEGQRARKRAASGSAPELSVGFIRRAVDKNDSSLITEAELVEVSQITLGMASQPGAELAAVRKAAEFMKRADGTKTPAKSPDLAHQEVGVPSPEEAYAVQLTDDDLTDEPIPASSGQEKRAVPGSNADRLHDYWTHGEGLAKWLSKPKPWTALYHHLLKYIKEPEKAKATAAKWYHDVLNHWPGDKSNRAAEGIMNRSQSKRKVERRSIDPVEGSYEALIDELREAIDAWAEDQLPDAERIYVSVVATFADHVVATIYVDDDYDGVTYSFPYVVSGDGEDVTLGSATQVELELVVTPADADDEGLGDRSTDTSRETRKGQEAVPDTKPEHVGTEDPPPECGERSAQELKRKAAALRLAAVRVA